MTDWRTVWDVCTGWSCYNCQRSRCPVQHHVCSCQMIWPLANAVCRSSGSKPVWTLKEEFTKYFPSPASIVRIFYFGFPNQELLSLLRTLGEAVYHWNRYLVNFPFWRIKELPKCIISAPKTGYIFFKGHYNGFYKVVNRKPLRLRWWQLQKGRSCPFKTRSRCKKMHWWIQNFWFPSRTRRVFQFTF